MAPSRIFETECGQGKKQKDGCRKVGDEDRLANDPDEGRSNFATDRKLLKEVSQQGSTPENGRLKRHY